MKRSIEPTITNSYDSVQLHEELKATYEIDHAEWERSFLCVNIARRTLNKNTNHFSQCSFVEQMMKYNPQKCIFYCRNIYSFYSQMLNIIPFSCTKLT